MSHDWQYLTDPEKIERLVQRIEALEAKLLPKEVVKQVIEENSELLERLEDDVVQEEE